MSEMTPRKPPSLKPFRARKTEYVLKKDSEILLPVRNQYLDLFGHFSKKFQLRRYLSETQICSNCVPELKWHLQKLKLKKQD